MRDEIVESRDAARYPAVKSAVYLGWWEEEDFRTCAAALQNLSHGGALVRIGMEPPASKSLWLCLAGSPPGEWVEVHCVSMAVMKGGSGTTREVRLKFPESCPYEMFQAAVLGIEDLAWGSS